VTGREGHCVWKIVVDDDNGAATVTVFAGDVAHQSGYNDGKGKEARFRKPAALSWSPDGQHLFVADSQNHAIRRIDRDGVVTTVLGGDSSGGDPYKTVEQKTRAQCSKLEYACQRSKFTQVGAAKDVAVFLPHALRVDSKGRVVFRYLFNCVRVL
jgi:hypothetical protein